MIPRTVPTWQILTWQDELKQQVDTPQALLQWAQLDDSWRDAAQRGHELFPIRATPSYLRKIKPGDPHDPLLLQILPTLHESEQCEDYVADPLQEQSFMPRPGLIHKYRTRVLLIAATQCAINCRYCFRRHFDYQENHLSREQWRTALDYIADDKAINEVILSGGDPLSLSDRQLHWLTEEIARIPQVKRLRIHTRYPVILPARFTEQLLDAIVHPQLQTILVSHCNHPQEVDEHVLNVFERLKKQNILLLNQSVLLKNVNDSSKILASLSEKLFTVGALPYYLHLLDKVRGASFFAVEEDRARHIYRQLLASLPGYLVPKLVREVPGESSKTPLGLK